MSILLRNISYENFKETFKKPIKLSEKCSFHSTAYEIRYRKMNSNVYRWIEIKSNQIYVKTA